MSRLFFIGSGRVRLLTACVVFFLAIRTFYQCEGVNAAFQCAVVQHRAAVGCQAHQARQAGIGGHQVGCPAGKLALEPGGQQRVQLGQAVLLVQADAIWRVAHDQALLGWCGQLGGVAHAQGNELGHAGAFQVTAGDVYHVGGAVVAVQRQGSQLAAGQLGVVLDAVPQQVVVVFQQFEGKATVAPGARFRAMSAASTRKVPLPHIGSSRGWVPL